MRLTDATPVDVEDYTWGQRGDGSRRLPGMAGASMAWFGDVFDPRLNVLTDSDTHHEFNAVYSWGLDSDEGPSGGFMPKGDPGFPIMGDRGDPPDEDYQYHGSGIKGDETRLAEDWRSPNVYDDNPNEVSPADLDQLPPITNIPTKPLPTPGRGPGDSGAMGAPASPQLVRGFYNILGVSKRFSPTQSHGDLGTPYAALPDWHEFAIPNSAPSPTSSGATEPNTRTRQSTFTTLRIPPAQWGSEVGSEQAYDRWGA